MNPIKFPQDELAHNHAIEWWYWNGHLQDERGGRYSYMTCLFKANLKKVKFPFIKGVPIKTLYFCHSLVTDIEKNKFYPRIDYVSTVSKDSFSKPLLFINYANPIIIKSYFNNVIEGIENGHYFLKTEDIELKLHSQKKPLLEGGNGYLHLAGNKSTYYYSLTNLKTKGKIRIKNKDIKVTGKSWMDHQWANVQYTKDQWTWFSIQLEDNTEIVCFEYCSQKEKKWLASISFSDNKQVHSERVCFTPIGSPWKSLKTKAEYPIAWRIEIPDYQIDLTVTALVKNQEMVYGTINYWEGPLDIKGKIGSKKVSGVGFSELVGYPSKMNNIKFIRNTFNSIIRKGFTHVREKL